MHVCVHTQTHARTYTVHLLGKQSLNLDDFVRLHNVIYMPAYGSALMNMTVFVLCVCT